MEFLVFESRAFRFQNEWITQLDERCVPNGSDLMEGFDGWGGRSTAGAFKILRKKALAIADGVGLR